MEIDFSKADQCNSWPFQEARLIAKKINKKPEKGYILFQSGYGASGLPHIGTFGEVFRTQMIMNVFNKISDIPTKLITFSDDLDGLRKIPDNIPNSVILEQNLNKPLTRKALVAGKNVFCEKPLTLTKRTAEGLFSLADFTFLNDTPS